MLSFVDLATGPEFTVAAVDCRDDHRGWSTEQPRGDVRLVLVRHGGFRRRVRGVRADLDHTVGYLGMPGEEEHFAHPAGGDSCTSISLTPDLWRTMAGDAPRLDRSSLYVDGRLDLAHRQLLAATRAADTDYAATEGLVGLVATVVRQVVATTTPDSDQASTGDRALVAQARAVISDGHPAAAGLVPLAALLGVSPYRLSRAFTRELGGVADPLPQPRPRSPRAGPAGDRRTQPRRPRRRPRLRRPGPPVPNRARTPGTHPDRTTQTARLTPREKGQAREPTARRRQSASH